MPAYPHSYWQVHLPCCWDIHSLVLETISPKFKQRLKSSWDIQLCGLNYYRILGLSIGRQPLLDNMYSSLKYTLISLYTYSCVHNNPYIYMDIYMLILYEHTHRHTHSFMFLQRITNTVGLEMCTLNLVIECCQIFSKIKWYIFSNKIK